MKTLVNPGFFFNITFRQSSDHNNHVPCSEIISNLTTEWKKDSLGITGYRYSIFKHLIQCKADSITKTFLFDKLGKPSEIRKSSYDNARKNHVEYVHFILNIDSKAKRRSYEGLDIAFVFNENEAFLEEIIDGGFYG